MGPAELRNLLTHGETSTVEYKSEVNDSDLVETVVCLANGSGGYLLVGVDDRGRVIGSKPRHGDRTDPSRVEALILSRTRPAFHASVAIALTDQGEVLVIDVPTARTVVATSDGKYIRRAIDIKGNPQCLPMEPHEVLARASSVGAQDFSRIPVPGVELEDLSAGELTRFRRLAARTGGDGALATLSNADLLRALDLLTHAEELTLGALLLFGTEECLARRLPAYEIGFQELDGLAVRTSEISRVPLLQAMIEMSERVLVRNPEEEIEIGLFRVPLPRFAEVTVRELIANALVHRDYSATGATLVEISEAGLTVSNPGGFPEGITISNLLTTPPRSRNPALADAFKRAGLVERTGRGVNRAFESQLALGRSAPDYNLSNPRTVVVRVRPRLADKKMAGLIAEARQQGDRFSLQDLLALHEVRVERRITTARAAELFQVGVREAREVLNDLTDRGLLETTGRTRDRTYNLSAAVYHRLGEPARHSWVRGFDRIQQEQMVLTFVDRHGSISRREAADLCRIPSERASRLLRRLRDEGALELVGRKRAARYVRPNGA
ncbi:MAG: putative DNA binding domain-containing protein [bacterium]|nr:putative DNA binding domain-containing protein [bacterium]